MAQPLRQQRLKQDVEPGSATLSELLDALQDTYVAQDTFVVDSVAAASPARALQTRLQEAYEGEAHFGYAPVEVDEDSDVTDRWSTRRMLMFLFVSCGLFWAGVFALFTAVLR